MAKKKTYLMTKIAKCEELKGNDLRMALLLLDNPRGLRPRDIAEQMLWSRPAVSRSAGNLERVGLLTKHRDDRGTLYKLNRDWEPPNVRGQITFDLSAHLL